MVFRAVGGVESVRKAMNETNQVNVNPALKRATVGDVVQRCAKPNIGALGVVRSVDETGVTAVNRSPNLNDGSAVVFPIPHAEYTVIGKAVIKFPRDPEEPRPARFNVKPEEVAAANAEAAISEAIERPTDVDPTAPPEPPEAPPTPKMPQPPPQTPPGPQTPGPLFIPKVTNAQREQLGGITVSGQPAKPPPTRGRPAPPAAPPPTEPVQTE